MSNTKMNSNLPPTRVGGILLNTMNLRWNTYFSNTKDMGARPLLVEALSYVNNKNYALDIGCGVGADTYFLSANGFSVTSVDSASEVKEYLPDAIISTFTNFPFPIEKYDLVNAQYSLPFNPPTSFINMFEKLTKSLKSGGIFTGQFFGEKDSWSHRKEMTFYTEKEIKKLLEPYKIQVSRERKEDGKIASGEVKFWHVFNIIAEKK